MPRRPRNQTTQHFHHVMGRGCRGQPLFTTDADRLHFTYLLHDVVERFDWTICNWVLMPNHHHLVVGLEEENLAQGMHRLHGLFAQRWNERTGSSGHVFFRRYKNIPMRQPAYVSKVMRYIDLNPVRAGLCDAPEEWEWSGYNAIIGRRAPLPFHSSDRAVRLISNLETEPAQSRLAYRRFVHARIARDRGRGTPADSRPSLGEILIPGDGASLLEAHELWGYSARTIGKEVNASAATVMRWIHDERFPRIGERESPV